MAIEGRALEDTWNYRRAVSPASLLFVREVVPASKKAQIILKELILDTLTYSKDSINTWWANVDRYGTDLALAQNYLNDNQFNDALVLLNNAYTKYNLSTEQTNDLNIIITIYQLLQQKTLEGLDENDLDNLKVIADDLFTVGSASLAKSILQYHGFKLFPPVYFLPTENENARLISEDEEKLPFELFVQPNPAGDYIEFRWNKLPKSPSIRIFNTIGKLMWEGNLSDKIDYFHLNTDFLQSGIYFYQLYSNGKPTYLKAGKLIIQKR